MVWKWEKQEDRINWAKEINKLGGLASEVINRIVDK